MLRRSDRAERIAKRRADMPKVYRATYDKAMTGKSLKAASKSFCLECMMWQREEVRLCTSFACPLWLYRPYKDKHENGSNNTPESRDFAPESTNTPKDEDNQL
jgi:hypothetical protein